MAAAIPYVIMAVGTAAQISAQNEQKRDQRKLINQAYDQLDAGTSKTSKAIAEAAQQYDAQSRQQGMDEATQQIAGQQTKDLGGAGATMINGAGDAGNVSQDYLTAKADRAVSEGTRLSNIAKQIAKTRAPGSLMTKEGLNNADTMGNVSSIWGTARGLTGALTRDAGSVQAPGYGQLGSVASAIGGAMAAGGYGSGGGAGVVSGGDGVQNVSSNGGLRMTGGSSGGGLRMTPTSVWRS